MRALEPKALTFLCASGDSPMDEDVVLNTLERLRRCLRRVQDKVPETAERLMEDYDA